jgi:hypothetical protein
MLRIGLTGGIACGKSAVAGMLRELGFHVLDADALGPRVILLVMAFCTMMSMRPPDW